MGGTTAKIWPHRCGEAQTSRVFEVARIYRFRRQAAAVAHPVIEMVEIGAGGARSRASTRWPHRRRPTVLAPSPAQPAMAGGRGRR